MLKKSSLILASLLFALGILVTSVVRVSALTPAKTPTPVPTTTPPEVKEVDYYLPYPGILPDHFLYPIKMIRDRVLLFFTTDPLKKAELLLLLADKRLGAAKVLIEGGKEELGITTLTKAEKYLERAVSEAKIAREKSKDTSQFLERLTKAIMKHEEVLVGLKEKTSGSGQSAIEKILEYPRRALEDLGK